MSIWRQKAEFTKLESRLRTEWVEPRQALIDKIVERRAALQSRRYRPRYQLALAAALTAVLLSALAAVGGVSYAASNLRKAVAAVADVVSGGDDQQNVPRGPRIANRSAAGDQYGPPGPFLPPGLSADQVLRRYENAAVLALNQLHARQLAECAAANRRRPGSCDIQALRRQQQGQINQVRANWERLRAREDNVPESQRGAFTAILLKHIEQRDALNEAQLAELRACRRRAGCDVAALQARHARQDLQLITLQRQELEQFLTSVGARRIG
jgi:hypothetical protein